MRRALNLIGSFLLITVLSLPALLFFHSQYQLHEHKEQMEQQLLKVQSVEVIVPVASIEWEYWGKEIRINGKLFDLLSIDIQHGQARCRGIFDEEEELLEARLEQLLSQTSTGSNSRSLCKQWFSLTLHFKPISTLLPDLDSAWLKKNYPSPKFYLRVLAQKLLSPPPEC